MKKFVYVFLFVMGLSSVMSAQEYKSAIGVRLGDPLISASYKMFVSESNAIELMAGFSPYGVTCIGCDNFMSVSFRGAYLFHNPIGEIDGFSWYWGPGAGVRFWTYDSIYNDVPGYGRLGVAVGAYGGVEYTLQNAPFTFSVDVGPHFVIGGFDDGFEAWGNVAARYIIGAE